MSETGQKLPRRRLWKYLLSAAVTGLLLLLAFGWYMTTGSFQASVRRRLVAELERITGGRVDLGSFHTIPLRLRVEVRDLTIHGREARGEVPYAHVDRLTARLKVISLLGVEFGFHALELDHPVVHIITYPGGSTNQPEPKLTRASDKTPVEQLFALSIGRLEVRRGEVLWDNQRIPLEFAANDLALEMNYALLSRRYESRVQVGKVETRWQGFRPFAWRADAQLSLGQNHVEVKSLQWSSGRSYVDASGRVDDFRQPAISATFNARFDLGELGSVLRRRELRGGTLELSGQGARSASDFSSAGKLLVKDFEWQDTLTLHKASLNTQFSVTPERLALAQLQARLLGGNVSGDAEITHWLQSQPPLKASKRRTPEEQKGVVRLRLKDLPAAAVAAAFSTPWRPLDRMKLAGTGAGTVEIRWKGSPRNADAEVALDVVPPAQVAPGQLPLTAHARGVYHSSARDLEVAEFSASTRATQVRAAGTLSSSAGLKISASTTNLEEWQPILAALGGPVRIPVALQSRASFTGTASGALNDVTLAGHLQVGAFDSLLSASSRAPERQVHWDSLTADLQLSPRAFVARNGTLRRDGTDLAFELSSTLQQGSFTDASRFAARLDVHNADLAELATLAGYEYPMSGRMDLFLQAGGTTTDPHGEGRVQIANGRIYGEPIPHLTSDWRFLGGEAQFSNLQLAYYGARITGEAAYRASARAFRFNLAGTDFDLARIPKLQSSRLSVAGRMDFRAQGSGTLDEPSVSARVRLRELTLNHERAGNFDLDAVTEGADLRLTGRSRFERAELAMDGTIRLRDPWPADLTLRLNHLDLDPLLLAYLRGHVTGHSAFSGDLRMQGALRQPRQLSVAGNLGELYVDIENVKLHNDGPVRFSVAHQVLTLDQLRLTGEGTDLSAQGTVQLTGERELALRADGRINLKLLESLNSDFLSSGMVTASVNVAGSISNLSLQGRLQVADGAISYSGLPSGLSNMNGSLVFNQDRLQIETLTARTGGGALNLGGFVTYGRQVSFQLSAQGRDVRLRYPPGVSATSTTDLRLAGTPAAATLSGDITITKLGLTPGFDFGLYLERSKQSSSMPPRSSLLNRIRLDVHVVTTPELQMQTAVAKLSGNADLRLRGTAARPNLLGRADVLEGEVYINGTKYNLERGDVTFTGPTISPSLDLQATAHVRDYDVTVGVTGSPDKGLKTKYRSEPPLPEADIIALLALGRTREESAALQSSSSNFTQEASNAILGEAINATVSSRVQKLFGVSRIKIDPQGLNTETNPARGPQVTIEQQVANSLTLTYSTSVSQTSQQIIQLEYNISRNVSIVAVRDQNGVLSFDVRIRQRRK